VVIFPGLLTQTSRINEGVASPVELAKDFGEPLGNVSYHVRVLVDLDCIELVDTVHRRGAVEHYYRATRRAIVEDAGWEQLAPEARRGIGGGEIGRAHV